MGQLGDGNPFRSEHSNPRRRFEQLRTNQSQSLDTLEGQKSTEYMYQKIIRSLLDICKAYLICSSR